LFLDKISVNKLHIEYFALSRDMVVSQR